MMKVVRNFMAYFLIHSLENMIRTQCLISIHTLKHFHLHLLGVFEVHLILFLSFSSDAGTRMSTYNVALDTESNNIFS